MANRTEPEVWVPISLAQAERLIQQVVGAKGPGVSLIRVLLALGGLDRVDMADLRADPEFDDRNLSRTLIIGLLVLAGFPPDHSAVKLTDMALATGLSHSTMHRYVTTLMFVGLLEQDPQTRSYNRSVEQ